MLISRAARLIVRTLRNSGRALRRGFDTLTDLTVTNPALIAAAAEGHTRVVEELLCEGADVDIQNSRGETALHRAATRRRAETAACLLTYGASHTIADGSGRTPLGPQRIAVETLHAVRQHHRRFRNREFAGRTTSSPSVRDWLSELNRAGMVKVSGLVTPDELAKMQNDFGQFISKMDTKIERGEADKRHYDEEEHWWPQDRAYVTNNAFKYSPQLTRFCCKKEVVELANLYIGAPAFITRGVAMRYLPDEEHHNDMFGWHHDMEEKRLKFMILLTDVRERDQSMSYVVGSYKLFHPYKMFFRNSCTLDYCREHLGDVEIRSTVGRAGDVFLFDSNGAHRGNCRPDARIRDAVFIEYNADTSNIWGGDVDLSAIEDIEFPDGNPLERLASVERKWNRPAIRKSPTWVENLPHVERWRN